MTNNGVVISLKEIYDEVLKNSQQVNVMATRMEKVEKKLERQEEDQRDFRRKLQLQLITTAIPIVLAVIYFVIKNGGL